MITTYLKGDTYSYSISYRRLFLMVLLALLLVLSVAGPIQAAEFRKPAIMLCALNVLSLYPDFLSFQLTTTRPLCLL